MIFGFKDFIKENTEEKNSNVNDRLKSLSSYFYSNGFLAKMYVLDDSIILMDLKKRNSKFSGTDVMLKICDFADKNNLKIKLVASPNYGTEIEKLIKFYNKFNFSIVGDYFPNGKEMVRYPNQ